MSASASPSDETVPLLEVQDMRVSFDTARGVLRAVDGVSFRIERGRTLGVVGESGSGKSVLGRALMGLVPDARVDERSVVRFEGEDLRTRMKREAPHFLGVRVAMIFQDPMTSLTPTARIGRQISEPLRFHRNLGRREASGVAIELLTHVGIPEPERRLREYPHTMSGGMRQRVMIAIALSCGPQLLIADEPTTSLDVTIQQQILALLKRLQAETHMAMILITHDLGIVAGRTDDVAVMYAGRIVEQAPTRMLFRETRHPYTQALLGAVPRVGEKSKDPLTAITGRPPVVINPPPGCRFAPRCDYAQPTCLVETPLLEADASQGHFVACFFPVDTPKGRRALEDNRRAGRTATGRTLVNPGGS